MKFVLESDGTLVGTRMEFSMTADEIPRMIEAHQRRKTARRLVRSQPPDVVVSVGLPDLPPIDVTPDPTDN